MAIKVRPLTRRIGAVIEDVDASRPLDDVSVKTVREALLEHLVVFLRDQHLSAHQFKAFGQQFGELERQDHMASDFDGDLAEIHLVDVPAGGYATEAHGRGRYSDQWHTDVTDRLEPPLGSILRPRLLPPVGGDTLWANMYAAYDALSPQMQALLEPLSAVHAARFDPVEHPVVRTHPETGRRSLFVSRTFTRSIVGLPAHESDALLRMLFAHQESVDFQVRWSWRLGDIAFWDNRATMHYAVHDYDEARTMERMTLKGDRPIR